ncbi:DUF2301 domain-containing membrane protein [Vibrio rarus]|uniref:DUF2301 domain-containing membrane protein n=1 Tax=Vibrio rarus TaxID=413403 RepID=UPI0021C34174|nr:DUF2301 domain-containing membrane protein [Vibrio rarus]
MANPEHEERLDCLDKVSVLAYRLGITVFSVALLLLSLVYILCLFNIDITDTWGERGRFLMAIAAALCAATLHVYDKHVRAIISWSSWIGLVLLILFPELQWLYSGFLFVTFSGIAFKESYCFKLKALTAVPLLLILSVLMLWMKEPTLLAILLGISGGIFTILSVKKWQMPLHFDIGNKEKYQI